MESCGKDKEIAFRGARNAFREAKTSFEKQGLPIPVGGKATGRRET